LGWAVVHASPAAVRARQRRAAAPAAIPRMGPTSAQGALELYTSRAAGTMPFEEPVGRIRVGAQASFVVLDADLFTIDPDRLDTMGVAQTWLAGECVHER
jgi:predicted amidohydrolase YtcJ